MSYEDNTKLKITSSGIELPDIETIYNSIISEWSEVFGGDLRTENRLSPQGQLAMSIAKQIDNKNKALTFFINQFNTNTATGNFLDYQYNNFGIYRDKGTKSQVTCDCTLSDGTTINIGDEIQNLNGDIFVSTENYTAHQTPDIKAILFVAKEVGAIECKANTVNQIVTTKEGWTAVNNASDGTIGYPEENDDQFRVRAMNSHMINALGTDKALYAKLINLDGVSDVYIISNRINDDITEDGITIKSHSTYICIEYDNTEETKNKIGEILHYTCSTATYIGNTEIDIPIENAPNNQLDKVVFQTAVRQNVYLKVTIKTLLEYNDSTDNKIKEIILDNFNGEIENIQKCRIGDLIEANRFYENLVYLQGTNECTVSNIQISSDNANWGANIKIKITDFPYMDRDFITIEKDN